MRSRLVQSTFAAAGLSALLLVGPAVADDGPWVDSIPLARGGWWSVELAEAGVYEYYCTPHPWMKGRLQVDSTAPASDATVNVTIQNLRFDPDNLLVRPGTNINWTNRDDTLHTVTGTQGRTPGGVERWQVVVGVVSLVGIAVLMARLLRGGTKPFG